MTRRRSAAKPKKPAKKPATRKKPARSKPEPKPKDPAPKPKHPDSGLEAAAIKGDDAGILRAALKILTREAETADAGKVPGLIREIRAVSRELKILDTGKEGNSVDEVKAQRERRRSSASTRK